MLSRATRAEAAQIGADVDSITIDADGQRAEDGSDDDRPRLVGRGERCVVMAQLARVEGYIGSATRRLMMASKPPKGCRYLLIHAINPWGMVQFRRVTSRMST